LKKSCVRTLDGLCLLRRSHPETTLIRMNRLRGGTGPYWDPSQPAVIKTAASATPSAHQTGRFKPLSADEALAEVPDTCIVISKGIHPDYSSLLRAKAT